MNAFTHNPSIILESSRGIQPVLLTDKLYTDNREIFLTEEIDTESCNNLILQLLYLDRISPGEEIKLYINSPGGSTADGLAVYDVMRMLKSPITAIVTGRACSMGAILFLAADKRLLTPHSEVMIHDASFANADFSGLKPDEISEKSKDLLKTCDILRKIVADRTNQPLKKVQEKMKKDSFFKAKEAIEFGLATGILTELP